MKHIFYKHLAILLLLSLNNPCTALRYDDFLPLEALENDLDSLQGSFAELAKKQKAQHALLENRQEELKKTYQKANALGIYGQPSFTEPTEILTDELSDLVKTINEKIIGLKEYIKKLGTILDIALLQEAIMQLNPAGAPAVNQKVKAYMPVVPKSHAAEDILVYLNNELPDLIELLKSALGSDYVPSVKSLQESYEQFKKTYQDVYPGKSLPNATAFDFIKAFIQQMLPQYTDLLATELNKQAELYRQEHQFARVALAKKQALQIHMLGYTKKPALIKKKEHGVLRDKEKQDHQRSSSTVKMPSPEKSANPIVPAASTKK